MLLSSSLRFYPRFDNYDAETKVQKSGNIGTRLSWDAIGVILSDYQEKEATNIENNYAKLISIMCYALTEKHGGKLRTGVLHH